MRKNTSSGIKHRDNEGMDRFNCGSLLNISVSRQNEDSRKQHIKIHLVHHVRHVLYYDVQLPDAARDIIQNNLWAIPSALAAKIHEDFPKVSSQQVYRAWATFSETMWKRADDQMESATMLLEEMDNEVDILSINCEPGVKALAWGLKNIIRKLSGKIVEVAIDATCKLFDIFIELLN
ncbi:MAG TPA: hypothetical protein VGO47_05155 [Chlamydiales bacterium]|nr:hypothetical protein [Chlamydiales bacterium]